MSRAARTAVPLVAALAALAAAGCASSDTAAEGIAEQREVLADRRAATRGAMEEAMVPPTVTDSVADAGGSVLGWLGRAGADTLDFLTLGLLGP